MNISAIKEAALAKSKQEALEILIYGDLHNLDALVGDCSCQIRAACILQLYNKVQKDSIHSLTDTEKEFLALCRLLTKAKLTTYCCYGYKHEKETHDFTTIIQDCSVTKAKEVVRIAQNRLATLSVNFIQQESLLTNDLELTRVMKYSQLDNKCFKRPICAAYPVMKVILKRMITLQHALVIKCCVIVFIALMVFMNIYFCINRLVTHL